MGNLDRLLGTTVSRYVLAAIVVLVTIATRSALDPLLGPNAPYMPFALALVLVGRFAGRGPALAATALSVVGVAWFFLEPRHSVAISSPSAAAALALFAVVGVFISLFVGNLRETLLANARAEARLRRQAQLINLSHDAVILADAHRVITSWNRGAQEMYGWRDKDAAGRVIHELLQTRNLISTAEIDEFLARDGRWDGELIHTASDGHEIVTESRQVLLRAEDGAPAGVLEINRDITQRSRALAQLDQEHRKTLAILESISDGFNAFDREWRYTYVNAAAARLVGKSPQQLLGKILWDVWPEAADSPFGAAYRRAVDENLYVQLEAFFPPLNAWLEVRCYPSPDGLTIFFTDTTERRQARERFQQVQKMESIGVLAGGVAHDFNNILTVVTGSAGCALQQCPSCEYAQTIVSASERAAHLTTQLLAFAGKGHAVVQTIHLTELVSRARPLLAASVPPRATLSFSLSEQLPRFEADPGRIEQILMNLVINAGEAIPVKSSGQIQIATGSCQISPEKARQQAPRYEVEAGSHVWLKVQDNGSGMDDATAARMFDPFFSTKFTGRGLGLAAVDGIVRSGRGFIEVHTAPGRGTGICVFLPAAAKNVPARPLVPLQTDSGHPACTVLVVEDEDMVRKLACTMLRRKGYRTLEAKDGKHALQVLAEAPEPPAVVLLDLAMPVMGGEELAPVLARQYPGLKIIVCSGYPEEEARRISPQGVVAGFLPKPYSPGALGEKIAQVLATR